MDKCGFLVLDPDSLQEIPEDDGAAGGGAASAAAKDADDASTGVGEIFVHGANLAEGYVNRPELDAAAVVILREVTDGGHLLVKRKRRWVCIVCRAGSAS